MGWLSLAAFKAAGELNASRAAALNPHLATALIGDAWVGPLAGAFFDDARCPAEATLGAVAFNPDCPSQGTVHRGKGAGVRACRRPTGRTSPARLASCARLGGRTFRRGIRVKY